MKDDDNRNKTTFDTNEKNLMELRDLLSPFQGISPKESSKDKWLLALNSRTADLKTSPQMKKNPIFARRFLELTLAACLGFGLSSLLHHFATRSPGLEENMAYDATELHLSAKSE